MLKEEQGKKTGETAAKDLPVVERASLSVSPMDTDGDIYEPFKNLPNKMQGLYAPKPKGALGQAATNWLFGKGIPGFFALLRTVAPIVRFPFTNTIIITRFDDVQEVFCRKDDFFVPYIKMSSELNWAPTFLLAMKRDDNAYQDMLQDVRKLWSDGDLQRITEIADGVSKRALESHVGEIDAIQDLMMPVVLHVIQDYYGIPIPGLAEREQKGGNIPEDEKSGDIKKLDAFIAGCIAMAGYLFGPQTLNTKKIQDIQWACNSVWPIIYDAANREPPPADNTIIGRAKRMRAEGTMEISNAALRSYLLGMIVGFLPTNTNANGRSFDVLMKRDNARKAAQDAVDGKDDAALLGVIYEALRLQYILPGVWREMEKSQSLRIESKRPKELDRKRLIYISGLSAMQDRRRVKNPKDFVPDRSRDTYLIYGHRFHYCVGAHLSDKMMLGMFQALLGRRAKYKKGQKLKFRGNMPWNLVVTYNKEA